MDQQSSQPDNQENSVRKKGVDEKFCDECGEIIKSRAEICPKCGIRQKRLVSKPALLLITFFLGGIGAHKFYIQKNWQGFFYLVFCWTAIPGLIALIEFIMYIFTSSEELQRKYSASSAGVVIAVAAGGFFMLFILGILAAIAIPAFVNFKNKACQTAVRTELQNVLVAEQNYFYEHNTYSTSLRDLNITSAEPEVTVEITDADQECFLARGTHSQLHEEIWIDCNGQVQQN